MSQASSGVQEVNEQIHRTSVVTEEVTRDIGQVNQATHGINKGSIKVNESAQALSGLANALDKIISRFKL